MRKKVFDGKLIKVFISTLKLPDGRRSYFEEVKHPGASIVVPFLKGKIVFLRQYRAVTGKYLWELPAGKLSPGESPYSCAKREVTEETGYKVSGLRRIGMIYTSPGFCDEKIHVYRAVCSHKSEMNLDWDEIIEVRPLSRTQIKKLFKTGALSDAKSIAALAFAGIL